MLDSSSFFGISANRFRSRGPLSRRCGSGILTAGALRTSCLLFLNFGSLAPVPLGALRRRCVCLCRTGSFRLRRACERCVCLPASPAPYPHGSGLRVRSPPVPILFVPYLRAPERVCDRGTGQRRTGDGRPGRRCRRAGKAVGEAEYRCGIRRPQAGFSAENGPRLCVLTRNVLSLSV